MKKENDMEHRESRQLEALERLKAYRVTDHRTIQEIQAEGIVL